MDRVTQHAALRASLLRGRGEEKTERTRGRGYSKCVFDKASRHQRGAQLSRERLRYLGPPPELDAHRSRP